MCHRAAHNEPDTMDTYFLVIDLIEYGIDIVDREII